MNRRIYLPRGYCEIGFANEIVTIDQAVRLAIQSSLTKAAQKAKGNC